jgi:hypothetical protein
MIERIAGFCSTETYKQGLILRIHGMAWEQKMYHLQGRSIMPPPGGICGRLWQISAIAVDVNHVRSKKWTAVQTVFETSGMCPMKPPVKSHFM